MILHTDHCTITRLEYLLLARIDAKHYRWHAELTQGGSMLLYRAGTGALHTLPHALGRHPPDRDKLISARTGEMDAASVYDSGRAAGHHRGRVRR